MLWVLQLSIFRGIEDGDFSLPGPCWEPAGAFLHPQPPSLPVQRITCNLRSHDAVDIAQEKTISTMDFTGLSNNSGRDGWYPSSRVSWNQRHPLNDEQCVMGSQFPNSMAAQILLHQAHRAGTHLQTSNLLSTLASHQTERNNLIATAVQQQIAASLAPSGRNLLLSRSSDLVPQQQTLLNATNGNAATSKESAEKESIIQSILAASSQDSQGRNQTRRQSLQNPAPVTDNSTDSATRPICVSSNGKSRRATVTTLPCQARGMSPDHNSLVRRGW